MRAYKAEKSVEEHLTQLGYTVFVPKKLAVRVYHGRKGRYLVPAIPSMVFVNATKESLIQAKQRVEKLQFVMSASSGGNQPLVVADKDMSDFIKVASKSVADESISYLTPDEVNIARGSR
ncbi:MAG: transcriptional regulator, partial [Candidatus Amulumruptor sp.]